MLRCALPILVLSLVVVASVTSANANPVVLKFHDLQNDKVIWNFYNSGSRGNFGISFPADEFAQKSYLQQGSRWFAADPANTSALFAKGAAGTSVTDLLAESTDLAAPELPTMVLLGTGLLSILIGHGGWRLSKRMRRRGDN